MASMMDLEAMREKAAAYTSRVEADLKAQTTSLAARPNGMRAAYIRMRTKSRKMESNWDPSWKSFVVLNLVVS